MWQRLIILLAFALIVELIIYLGLRRMLRRVKGSYIHDVFMFIHWTIPIGVLLFFVIQFVRIGDPGLDYEKFRSYFIIFGIFLLLFAPRLVFSLSVLLQSTYYGIRNLANNKKGYIVKRPHRRSYLVQKIGLVLSFVVMGFILHGMLIGKTNYKVENVEVAIADLPKAFEGYKIVHFSDAHMGSFIKHDEPRRGFEMINAQNADLILFSGDMVNNVADELKPFVEDLKNLKAKDGKYAVLGNHDMGDYVKWNEFETKEEHILKLVQYQNQAGFKVLRNQSVVLKRGRDSIALMGIDNWGQPPFKQYGDLKKAHRNVQSVPVKVLISHDPSHWDAEVVPQSDIDLTVAGHTHGMQFGFRIGDFRWSPSKFIYPKWWGLYQTASQYLYVNPGFGYIGFPGRVGIPPEVTVLTLVKPAADAE